MNRLCLLCILLLPLLLHAQEGTKQADSLQYYNLQIKTATTESARYFASERLSDLLSYALNHENSLEQNFDQLKSIAQLATKDNKLRIFNWHIQKDNGNYEYFALIQRLHQGEYSLMILNDIDSSYASLVNYKGSAKYWPGAHYYELIEEKTDGTTYYTLLGWDGNNLLTNKKVIDVLYFDDYGTANFGAPIFKTQEGLQHRVIFEYGGGNSMSLRYNTDLKRILFDHLSPAQRSLTGIYEYYGPDLSYDAFDWNGKLWEYQKDIDADEGLNKKEKFFYVPGKDTIKSNDFSINR